MENIIAKNLFWVGVFLILGGGGRGGGSYDL